MNDSLKKLDEKIDELFHSTRNNKISLYWKPQEYTAKDHWRGIPRKSSELNVIPFTVEPEHPFWAELLGFDLQDFYSNPRSYVENTLNMMIYRFEKIRDCACIEKTIPIWLGPPFESTLLGSKVINVPGESPWIDRDPVIQDYQDLDRLVYPDFLTSGLMPMAHRMYHEINELVEGKYSVVFPEWGRGPFGVALHVRGHNNLLMDMVENPEFVHRLMRFITDARKHWIRERATFLDRPVDKGNLYNDEVNCPTLSPAQYREFVLPYERELTEFHGGITYWHSCGDITRLLPSIREVGPIDMVHVGPWTDSVEAGRVFGHDTALEKCLMPTADVQLASQAEMEAKLESEIRALDGTSYTIRADGLQVTGQLDHDLAQIRLWVDVAGRMLSRKN